MHRYYLFQWITIPFAMTNSHTVKIAKTSSSWVGTFDQKYTGEWLDFTLLLVSKTVLCIISLHEKFASH